MTILLTIVSIPVLIPHFSPVALSAVRLLQYWVEARPLAVDLLISIENIIL